MGTFEDIAILDLKFRVVMVVAIVVFASIALPLTFWFETKYGFPIGVIGGAVAGAYAAKRLW